MSSSSSSSSSSSDKKEGRASIRVKNENKDTEPSTTGQVLGTLENLKPGQKFMTPSPGNGDRVFYETLLEQRPDSEMAQDWCIQYGVLSHNEAQKLLDKISRRKPGGKSSPATVKPRPTASSSQASQKDKGSSTSSSSSSSRNKKSKVTVEDEDGYVMDGVSEGAVWEGRGTMGI